MTNEKNTDIFICESCNFTCNRPAEYVRHLETNKHSRLIHPIEKTHSCLCGKIYKHRPSLYKHKKSCSNLAKDSILDIVKEIAREQKEFIMKYAHNVQIIQEQPIRVIKQVREKKVIGFTCPKNLL